MTNGQEKARENLVAFQRWAATKTDDDLKQIVFRGQLNRGEVANAIGIGESAVRQNPAIKSLVLKYLGRIAACGERAETSISWVVTTRVLVSMFGIDTKCENQYSHTHSLDWDIPYSYSTPI